MTELVIILLTIYCILATIVVVKLDRKKEIYYSNYQNCLRALAGYDKSLAEYLEKEGKI